MARISFEEFSSGLPVRRQSEVSTPTTSEQSPVSTETVGNRLADIGQDVGSTISSAIAGEGQFAGQTPLERGVTATAAGFSTVPRGALAMAPEFVRTGVEKVGDVIGKGFGAVTGALAKTPLIKEAVGYQVTDPETGATRFVEQDLGLLESGLNIAQGSGEIAGTITGARAVTPGTPSTRLTGSAPKQGTIPVRGGDTVQPVKITNGVEANEEIFSQFADKPTGITATIQGVGQQLGDFTRRTVREAQETAQDNARLAALPEPEARIRKNVADERVIDLVESMTPEEVGVVSRLVDQAKLKQGDITPNTAHPKKIAGEELLKPVQFIIDERRSVGNQLGELRNQLSTTKNINTNAVFRDFHQFLKNNYGVQFDKNKQIVPGVGTLARGDVAEVQKLYDELRTKTFASQKEIDEFLQRSFKDYDLKQSREKTFSDEVSVIAERARSNFRQEMPEQYNALARQYAEMSKPLQDMVRLLGYKGSLDELSAKDLKAAEVGLRVLGNAADRPQSVIDDINRVAQATGYKSDVNINNILAFTDQLDDLYDITPTRSFAGQTARGIDQSDAVGVIGEAATMNIGGLYNRAMQSRATQKEIQEALEQYILSKNPAKPQGNKSNTRPNNQPATTKTTDLVEEAKGKSLEEFIGERDMAFHGTPFYRKIVKDMESGGSFRPSTSGNFGEGLYLSKDRNTAVEFAKLQGGGKGSNYEEVGNGLYRQIDTGEEIQTTPGLFQLDLTELNLKKVSLEEAREMRKKARGESEYTAKAKSEGYDGIDASVVDPELSPGMQEPQVVVFPDAIKKLKTRTQLEDIWKQANENP